MFRQFKLKHKIIYSTLLLCSVSFAQLPLFGVSGSYNGQLGYQGKAYSARLEIVQTGDVIRGFINTDIPYQDGDGKRQKGTTIFVKGLLNKRDLSVTLGFTSHNCSFISPICNSAMARDKVLEIKTKFIPYQSGQDYVLFQVNMEAGQAQNLTQGPFTSAAFKMDLTYSYTLDNSNPFYGIWDLIGFGATPIVYASAPISQFFNLTLFNNNGRDQRNIFFGWETQGTFFYRPANHLIYLAASNPAGRQVKLMKNPYLYDLRFQSGIAFGAVYTPDQVGKFVDFEGVMFGFSESQTSARSMEAKVRGPGAKHFQVGRRPSFEIINRVERTTSSNRY